MKFGETKVGNEKEEGDRGGREGGGGGEGRRKTKWGGGFPPFLHQSGHRVWVLFSYVLNINEVIMKRYCQRKGSFSSHIS